LAEIVLEGRRLRLAVDPPRFYFFDPGSGANMQRAKRPDELESRRFETPASASRK
jgi:hypothetical protein